MLVSPFWYLLQLPIMPFPTLLLLSSLLLLWSCSPVETKPQPPVSTPQITSKKAPKTPVDTIPPIHYWQGLKKQFINIDSAAAWAFVQNDLQHDYWKEERAITLQQVDLNNDQQEELFITFGSERAELYQKDKQGTWQEIWVGYDDGYGPPSICEAPKNWIEDYSYMSCSHCSQSGATYYKLEHNDLRPIVCALDAYNYDHEEYENVLYEAMDGSFEWKEHQLTANFRVEWQVLDPAVVLVKDTVQVVYQWREDLDSLLIQQVTPAALEPYLLAYYALEGRENALEDLDYRGHTPNKVAFAAYWAYKQQDFIQLKDSPIYNPIIQAIEQEREQTWKAIVEEWMEDSFLGEGHISANPQRFFLPK